MLGIKDKYLIVSMNDDFPKNQQLLDILSIFEYKEDSELHIILNEIYSNDFVTTLVNVFGYIAGIHYINHFIKVFTADNKLITEFNNKKDLLYINGIEMYSISEVFKQKIVELDTRLVKAENYLRIINIHKDSYSVYNTNICIPEIRILKIKGN